ncbi:MAG: UDP-N-acetylglucosamine 1-carboxyvinyltransferase [Patescibacteria group bacterium UBA2163]
MNINENQAFIITGSAGEPTLSGSVAIEGAKNAVLPIMAASLIVDGETQLTNVPNIADVHSMISLLEGIGAYGSYRDGVCSIRTQDAKNTILDQTLAKRLRASVLLIGATLARLGSVTFPHPGGCVLGSRPIDLFIEGFQTLGCSFTGDEESSTLTAPPEGLSGGTIFFRVMSVTATETFMMAAVRAQAPVTLKNCAMEPEVVATADFLKKCGARIEGAGTPTIIIHPAHVEPPQEPFAVIPDRIEAGSFLILGALLGKDVTITNVRPSDLDAVIEALRVMGVPIHATEDTITVSRPDTLRATDIRTHEHPGFPTDLQAPMTTLLTQAEGESAVVETIFDGRLNYIDDLVTMGADIRIWNPHKATVKGPTPLKARDIDGPDIRAGLAFLLAGAVASGTSRIGNAHLIDRGYQQIEQKFQSLGATIERT